MTCDTRTRNSSRAVKNRYLVFIGLQAVHVRSKLIDSVFHSPSSCCGHWPGCSHWWGSLDWFDHLDVQVLDCLHDHLERMV